MSARQWLRFEARLYWATEDRLSYVMQRVIVAVLLLTHAILLAWQASCYSPTVDEPAHLVSGLSHWTFGHFNLYRVNPPLIRLIASLPLLLADPQTDWALFTDAPYARPEFSLGTAFATANGFNTFRYLTIARWACIPISLLGAYFCYRWAFEMFGFKSGIVALTLWCFCPNILGNGALITPDVGGAAFGVVAGYCFWRWLRNPDWTLAIFAGVTMGLAELSKSTWIVLFGCWPMIWLFWRVAVRHRKFSSSSSAQTDSNHSFPSGQSGTIPPVRQLAFILLLGLYVLNFGYCFEDSMRSLGSFQFVSQSLGGKDAHSTPGNRFSNNWLGATPVPVPASYLRGIDVQRYDFERGKWSYLRGEIKFKGGWWYYYLYAMAVKIPTGTLCLFGLLIVLKAAQFIGLRQVPNIQIRNERPSIAADLAVRCTWLDEVVVLTPAIIVIVLVSSQTGFSRSLRYVLPAFPFLYIWISQIAWSVVSCPQERTRLSVGICVFSALALIASVTSSIRVLPHNLAYFNEIAGGPLNGANLLLDSNIDWDQDLLYVKQWYDAHPEARPFYFTRYGFIDPKIAGIDSKPVPQMPSEPTTASPTEMQFRPSGWFAISANQQFGERSQHFAWLRELELVGRCGYSIQIYHASEGSTKDEPANFPGHSE